MGAADLNELDDGVSTTLHFHNSDRARANHTGTQLASTVSDFTEAAQDAVGAMVATSIVYSDAGATMQRAALTGHVTAAQDSNALVLGSFTKTQLNTAVSDGDVQYVGDAPTAHTHLLAVGATDVTITAANLNILDDGLTTALHFHDADRARGVHTGTQLAATISDFSTAVAATASVTANTAKVTNATHTGDVTGATALTIAPTAISGKTLATAAGADHVLIFDATDSLLKKALVSDFNSGVSDGDKGDITVSAAGTTWTIDASTVTLAKQADMATGSLVYRKTAGAGAPEVQPLATLKTDLGLTGTNSGDQTITLTGAVTGSGVGSFSTSLGSFTTAQLNSAVSDADLPTLAANNAFTGSQTTSGTGTALTVTNSNSTTATQFQVAGSITFDTASLFATAINTTMTGGATTTVMRGQLLNTVYNPTLASPAIQNLGNQYTLNSGASPSSVVGNNTIFFLGASALGGTVAVHHANSVSFVPNAAATTNITNWISYRAINIVNGALQTVTNAYSFGGEMASGSGRRNLSMTGTAENVLSGNLFVGSNTSPTAKVHVAAGSATANTAPLKLTSGPLNTTPEAGAVEFLTGDFFGTNSSGTRKTFAFLESPALVTPALGTPASGVMTNVTGLTTAGLVDGSITTAKLAAAAVDTPALAALAVTSLKISSKAVSTGKIDDGAVTPAQIKIKAVVALADAAAVLSATQLVDSGIFTITPTAGRNLTTATATSIVAQLPDYQVGTWFEFTILSLAAFAVVLVAGAGVTIVGSATVNNAAGTWKCLVTSATTVTIYRT